MRIVLTLDRGAGGSEGNDYVRSLEASGFSRGDIAIVEPGSPASETFDGLLLGGGCDVDPVRYGQAPRQDANLELDRDRDSTDFRLFDRAWRGGVPVFGICRGVQVINVALGGTLVQDLPTERPSPVVHQTAPRRVTRLEHNVKILPDTRLAVIAGRGRVDVNSRHHQAILAAAAGLRVSAEAPDGVVEAVEAFPEGRWLIGVQWHPENLLNDSFSKSLFADFAAACREHAAAGISKPLPLLSRA